MLIWRFTLGWPLHQILYMEVIVGAHILWGESSHLNNNLTLSSNYCLLIDLIGQQSLHNGGSASIHLKPICLSVICYCRWYDLNSSTNFASNVYGKDILNYRLQSMGLVPLLQNRGLNPQLISEYFVIRIFQVFEQAERMNVRMTYVNVFQVQKVKNDPVPLPNDRWPQCPLDTAGQHCAQAHGHCGDAHSLILCKTKLNNLWKINHNTEFTQKPISCRKLLQKHFIS